MKARECERLDSVDPVVIRFWSVFGCGFSKLVAFETVYLFSECMFSSTLKLTLPFSELIFSCKY